MAEHCPGKLKRRFLTEVLGWCGDRCVSSLTRREAHKPCGWVYPLHARALGTASQKSRAYRELSPGYRRLRFRIGSYSPSVATYTNANALVSRSKKPIQKVMSVGAVLNEDNVIPPPTRASTKSVMRLTFRRIHGMYKIAHTSATATGAWRLGSRLAQQWHAFRPCRIRTS